MSFDNYNIEKILEGLQRPQWRHPMPILDCKSCKAQIRAEVAQEIKTKLESIAMQRAELATSLLLVLRKVGVLNDTEPSGPELLLVAEEFINSTQESCKAEVAQEIFKEIEQFEFDYTTLLGSEFNEKYPYLNLINSTFVRMDFLIQLKQKYGVK
jgi:hypothetical protein